MTCCWNTRPCRALCALPAIPVVSSAQRQVPWLVGNRAEQHDVLNASAAGGPKSLHIGSQAFLTACPAAGVALPTDALWGPAVLCGPNHQIAAAGHHGLTIYSHWHVTLRLCALLTHPKLAAGTLTSNNIAQQRPIPTPVPYLRPHPANTLSMYMCILVAGSSLPPPCSTPLTEVHCSTLCPTSPAQQPDVDTIQQ